VGSENTDDAVQVLPISQPVIDHIVTEDRMAALQCRQGDLGRHVARIRGPPRPMQPG
jgi:hypothetical protein